METRSNHPQIADILSEVAAQRLSEEEAYRRIKALQDGKPQESEYLFGFEDPLLRDHQLFGARILMGVAHCSLAIEAARKILPETQCWRLEKVSFQDAIQVLPGQSVSVRVEMVRSEHGYEFTNRYAAERVSAAGRLTQMVQSGALRAARPASSFDQVLKSARSAERGASFYSRQKAYGPSLQALQNIYRLDEELIGEYATTGDGKYAAQPAFFDSAYVNTLCAAGWEALGEALWVPLFIKEAEIQLPLPERWFCRTKLTRKNDEVLVTDHEIFGENGHRLAKIRGFTVKRVPSAEALGIRSEISGSPLDSTDRGRPPHPSPLSSEGRGDELKFAANRNHEGAGLSGRIETYVRQQVAPMLKCQPEEVAVDRPFLDLGANSASLIGVVEKIEKEIGIELYPTIFFEYQNIQELSGYLEKEHGKQFAARFGTERTNSEEIEIERSAPTLPVRQSPEAGSKDIAVIGMAGRFAQSRNLREFWGHLRDRTNLITEIPRDHWDYRPWFDSTPQRPNKTYCKWGSFLDGVDKFDPLFFHMSPREAEFTDPQLRHLLEVLYETAEDAGCAGNIWGSRTGMYVGVCFKEYWDEIVRQRVPITGMESFSSAMSFLANRPSYFFDLRGPSVPVDDACSSSLVALHLACKALQNGECEMAFAAGINVLLSPLHYVYFSAIGALSATGRCHTFDATADGYVPGEGIAAVLLKPLDRAIRDGDHIHAVVKGSALNHGGRANNPTSPRTQLQTEVIQSAWRDAGIAPETIGYIEAHGTGTLLGDPIEVEALKKAFKPFTTRRDFCGLGSVKANIGHTEGTAGIAGVVKAILCMKNGFIPAMPGLREVNPYLKLEGSPLYINAEGREWPEPREHPRRAGVSSFGMGGAYAHVVVEDYADARTPQKFEGPRLFVLSAQTEPRLREYAGRFLEYLSNEGSSVSVEDICHTLRTGRQHMDFRLAIVFQDAKQLLTALEAYSSGAITDGVFAGKRAANQPRVEANVEPRALAAAWVNGAEVPWDRWSNGRRIPLPTYPFERQHHWMPATGREGPELHGVAGVPHPLIDCVAPSLEGAHFRKTFSSSDRLVTHHVVFGQAVLPGVAHLEMALAAAGLLRPDGSPVLRNILWKRPLAVGAAGLECEIRFKNEGTIGWRICDGPNEHTTGRVDFDNQGALRVRNVDIGALQKRLPRNVGGETLYERFSSLGIEYGTFLRSVKCVWTDGREALAEIKVEGSELRSTRALDAMLQSSLALYEQGSERMGVSLPFAVEFARVWAEIPEICFAHLKTDAAPVPGREAIIDFSLLGSDGGVVAEFKQVSLRPAPSVFEEQRAEDSAPRLEPIRFFRPRWKHEPLVEEGAVSAGPMLVFRQASDCGFTESILKRRSGVTPIVVHLGRKYEKLSDIRYSIDCGKASDFQRVLAEFPAVRSFYFFGARDQTHRSGSLSFLRLVQALPSEQNLTLKVLTQNVSAVTGLEKELQPFGSSVAGLAKVASREFRNWKVSCIDFDEIAEQTIRSIEKETALETSFRNGRRFVRVLEELELPRSSAGVSPSPCRSRGVYLIAGGLGGLGFALSEYLAREFKARLVLVGRGALDDEKSMSLKQLEAFGAEVLYVQADIADLTAMQEAVRSAKSRFGEINGVVHSALVLADQSLGRMDDETLLSVLRPKIEGTIALELATRDERLDFTLFFSSANSFLANTGQANYVAACAFQDAFAEWLRASGRCPVLTVNWGLWGDVGIMARQGQIERLSALGVHPIGLTEGIECCADILAGGIEQVMAAKIDPAVLTSSGLRIEGRVQLLPAGFPSIAGIEHGTAGVQGGTQGLKALEEFCLARLRQMFPFASEEPPKGWAPKFRPLWGALSRLLANRGKSAFDGGRSSEFQAHFELAGKCLDALADIVSGKVAATEIIFPNASMELLEPIYAGNPLADFYNQKAAESIGGSVRKLLKANLGRPIRVLEIGAGTGGTSRFVLRKISEVLRAAGASLEAVDYVYTDLSDGFLRHGREQFGAAHPFARFRAFDIENIPEEQGTFDVVLAANVLHATRSISRTLANVKRLLRRNGILVLTELTAASAFTTVTFGLLDGWWRFEDAEARIPGTPLVSVNGWREALKNGGFRDISVIGAEFQSLMMGESDGLISFAQAQPSPILPKALFESPAPCAKDVPLTELVRREVALTLRLTQGEVDPQKRFSEYGVDSILSVELIGRLNKALDLKLKTTVLFDFSSIQDLAGHLAKLTEGRVVRAAPLPMKNEEPKQETRWTGDAVLGAVISGPGQIDDLRIEPIQLREPGPCEIQIRVRAFSINFGDWLCVRGLYPSMPEYPFVPGFEAAGVVAKTGSGAARFKVGDPVIALTGAQFGGHAEMITVDERLAVRKPEEISFEDSAAFPVVFLTALQAFERARVRAGEKVLIQTAAGGTGLMLVQLARQAGAEIYATAGSREKLDYLTGLGVQHVINYRERDFASEIRNLNHGRGLDVVFNTLSGDAIQKGLDLLEMNGRYVEIALTGLKSAQPLDLSRLTRNQSIHSINLLDLLGENLDQVPVHLDEMARHLRESKIIPTVARTFAFSELKEAYRELESRRSIGKVVVQVPGRSGATISPAREADKVPQKIAVVGMAGKFPEAENIEEFWSNLAEGKNCIAEVPSNRWAIEGFYDPNPHAQNRSVSKWGGFLRDIDQFDPLFFNISGREAERMDPQQRVFLEQAWHALEHAGYSGQSLSETKCGLFVGTGGGDYYHRLREAGIPNDGYIFTGNQPSILAGRLAYFLNLKGPALAVDTACSSSLVAIHLACQSIRSGESEMALAGGVFINTTSAFHLLCSKAGMLSPSGQCRAFDDEADGFVPGEGAGVVVLKSLERALADGDRIYGVILGSGTNQDGKTNGITAPSALSQTSLERSVYDRHGVSPESISYVETHGTGTKLGDPIEIDALAGAFRNYTKRTGFCALGSVKTNIGHSATAAGIASVIKVLLSFQHGKLPPSLNFERENAQLRFAETPFFVNSKLRAWESGDAPRRAAVSSFGFSGTNCHAVLEEAPRVKVKQRLTKPAHLFALSAKTPGSLEIKRKQLREWLRGNPGCDLPAVSMTLNMGRDHFEYRSALVANSVDELIAGLADPRSVSSGVPASGDVEKLLADLRTETSAPIYRANLAALAGLYENGCAVPWSRLYEGLPLCRIALPLYPFERQRYWIPEEKSTGRDLGRTLQVSGDESFVKDHVIKGESILPAAIYLEWARSIDRAFILQNCVWTLPLKIKGAPRGITVESQPDNSGKRLVFRSSEGVHFETHAATTKPPPLPLVDLTAIRNRCHRVYGKVELYKLFAARGICYGKSFQTIHELSANKMEAVARLAFSEGTKHEWVWPPGLLDGALQTVVALIEQRSGVDAAFVPYGLERLEVHADSLPQNIVAHATLVEAHEDRYRFDVNVLGEDGGVLLQLRGFGVRQLPAQHRGEDLQTEAENFLRRILSDELKISAEAIRATDPFEKFGIDSIMVNDFNELLEKTFGSVSKTLFFECKNLRELSQHFVQHHPDRLRRLVHNGKAATQPVEIVATLPSQPAAGKPDEDVAIIGMSGRFPRASNVKEFWANLRDGRDCISEIPPERWNSAAGFDPDPKKEGKVYTKWGGFIEDHDCFDPLFFRISPQEAELMDPQERHFLQIAYATIEDAGYTPALLREKCAQARGKDVGVFVGVMWGDYQLYGVGDSNSQAPLPWSAYWSIANRVSYTLDFKGPSLALDTACSSSLTAIHLACESLQRGHCRAALAGGVNLSLHPNKYRQLCQMKFASTDGRCRSFGAGGDGYVPGEGVGAVLLKPLSAALADGDHIYGVIKASGWNHGGKTNGYSVPNPIAQGDLIEDVIERSGVPVETIGFIEAHGTGTALGDPIEVTGLTRAFRKFTAKSQFCILGSAKANVGHLEAAAGVTALIKVLLQMKHGKVPPSLHAEVLNPNLRLEETPFAIRREFAEWTRPVREGQVEPRRAGVSSFGAGGANAHLIVEEFPDKRPMPEASPTELIVLSARTREQLLEKARQLKAAVEDSPEISLALMARTLQAGREPMDYRFACCVTDREDLCRKLDGLLARGGAEICPATTEEVDAEESIHIGSLFKNRKLDELGRLWTEGRNVHWSRLHGSEAALARVSLPTHPFARERFWVQRPEQTSPLPADIFFTTEWIAAPLGNGNGRHAQGSVQLLVFDDSLSFAELLEQNKNGSMLEVRIVTRATDAPVANGRSFSIRPGVEADFQWLAARLAEQKFSPTHVVLLWNYRAHEAERGETGLLALFYLTKALQSTFYANSIRLLAVFRNNHPIDIATSGFARTVGRETPNYEVKSVQLSAPSPEPNELREIIWEELNGSFADAEVRYEGKIRWARRIEPAVRSSGPGQSPFRERGVYLITGGLGELGTEFARFLAVEYRARIVLLGRGEMTGEKEKRLASVRALGGDACYFPADISDHAKLEEALKQAREKFGAFHGVLHLACVVEDALLYRKSRENFLRVLAPKVSGTVHLDALTKDDPLDFFVSFSSAVSLTGNPGQADYAAACRFQDAFAEYRNGLRASGKRSGRSLTIAWSQWEKAGHFAPRERLEAAGIKLLTIKNGWHALRECLQRTGDFYVVIDGEREKIHRLLGVYARDPGALEPRNLEPTEEEVDAQLRALLASNNTVDFETIQELFPEESSGRVQRNGSDDSPVMHHIEDALKHRLKLVLQPADRRKSLTEFGLDSINAVKLADDLQKRLGLEVNPKMFWDLPTVEALAAALTAQMSKEARA